MSKHKSAVSEQAALPNSGATKASQTKPEATFTKEQILNSERYREKRDLLSAILEENQVYSHIQIKEEIDKFTKERVR